MLAKGFILKLDLWRISQKLSGKYQQMSKGQHVNMGSGEKLLQLHVVVVDLIGMNP